MDITQHLELVRHEGIGFGPGVHIDQAADEIRPVDGQFLADTGAHSNHSDNVNIAAAEMIQQAGNILGIEFHRRCDVFIIIGIGNAAVVENDRAVSIRHAARKVIVAAMAIGTPSAHA